MVALSYPPVTPSSPQGGGSSRWVGRVAVVTGASAGIGAAVCRSLVTAGLVVVGVARQHLRVKVRVTGTQVQEAFKAKVKRTQSHSESRLVLGSGGMTVECAKQCVKERKQWRNERKEILDTF